MAWQPERPRNEINWDEIWGKLVGKKPGGKPQPKRIGIIAGIIVGIIVVIWLLTGIYTVGPGEVGVVRQFGKEVSQASPGLHWHWPGPIQRVDKVNMAEVRRSLVGFKEVSPGNYQDVSYEAQMLTGDENIVDIHVFVYYRVKDASQFLFKVDQVEQTLKTATEVALRHTVGNNPIDYVMIDGRAAVQHETLDMLQQLIDAYESGLVITEVKLQEVDAPEEVRDAFNDVVRAKEDKSKVIREAEGYAADIVPKARGEGEQLILEAEAYKEQRVIKSHGDAEKFLTVLEEYQKAPGVTRQRLYLETIERILPNLEKIIIDPANSGNLLQFLPLKDLTGSEPAGGGE
ncbi:FtsH protease activity modulator HflK [Chloroflexota bacterium]